MNISKVEIYELSPLEQEILMTLKVNDNNELLMKQLVEVLGRNESTIHDNMMKLIKKGFIKKYDKCDNKKGRPKKCYRVIRWN